MEPVTIVSFPSNTNRISKIHLLAKESGFRVVEIKSRKEVFQVLGNGKRDLLIIETDRQNIEPRLAVISAVREQHRRIPIFLITSYSSEQHAIRSIKAGVNDYFKVPVSTEELLNSIHFHLNGYRAQHSTKRNSGESFENHMPVMVGESSLTRDIRAYIAKIAATESTVLITGETGTGKGLAAEMIHHHSSRRCQPFVWVDCAALPETLIESELYGYKKGSFTGATADRPGKFEQAHGGTLFLDEIGELSLPAQSKILRTLEAKRVCRIGDRRETPVDIRIIAATNQEPERLVLRGLFRKDLYFRLNVVRLQIAPLRHRRKDISALVDHIIKGCNQRFKRSIKGVTPEAMAYMKTYRWPGNVRELMNLLEAIYVDLPSSHVDFAPLPNAYSERFGLGTPIDAGERLLITSTLIETDWNKSMAAKKLNWSRTTLYRKMAKYNISP